VVSASAGTGKTYQLSHRFLTLVASGAEPHQILAITFTNKAAGEMRERIIAYAAGLLADSGAQEKFNREMAEFFANGKTKYSAPPRTAEQTARLILAQTQSLKIKTIDGLFWQWLRKFAFESSQKNLAASLPDSFNLLSPKDASSVSDKAMDELCDFIASQPNIKEALASVGKDSIFELRKLLGALGTHETYSWYLTQVKSTPLSSFSEASRWETETDILSEVRELLTQLIGLLPDAKRSQILPFCRGEMSFASLREAKILKTSDLSLNGTTFRSAATKNPELVQEINDLLREFDNAGRKRMLAGIGSLVYHLYCRYNQARDRAKYGEGFVEFNDLLKGAFNLFYAPEAGGARFLIHKPLRHLMLDEFQDTSVLQWSIFEQISTELLGGENLAGSPSHATVFIVGDEKQSIYGFREADYRLMKQAEEKLNPFGLKLHVMTQNFRSSQVILDFVNEVFRNLWTDFPEHQAAHSSGLPLIPAHGSVMIARLFEDEDVATGEGETEDSALKREAKFVADFIQEKTGDQPLVVWDKKRRCFRTLRKEDCAILYRNATHSGVFEEELALQGIRVRKEEATGFFGKQEIRDLMNLLKWLAYPEDQHALVAVLKSKIFSLTDEDILPNCDVRGQPASGFLGQLEQIHPHVATLNSFLNERDGVFADVFYALTKTLDLAGRMARDEHGIVDEILHSEVEQWIDLAFAQIAQHSPSGWGPFYDLMDEVAKYGQVAGSAAGSDAVNVMTIHKAKGLEFPLVILVDCFESWEKLDSYWLRTEIPGQGEGLSYVGVKSERPVQDPQFDEAMELVKREARKENDRLLYVALTRAGQHLLVTGNRRRGKDVDSYFGSLENALKSMPESKDIQWRGHTLLSYGAELHQGKVETSPALDTPDTGYKPILQEADATYPREIRLRSPHQFVQAWSKQTADVFWRHWGRPIGVFVHRGLELAVKGINFDKEGFWHNLGLGRQAESEVAYERANLILQGVLDHPLWLDLQGEGAILSAELPCYYRDGETLVRGMIDLLVQDDHGRKMTVIDYKTVATDVNPEDLADFCFEKGYAGQLACYAKALRLAYPGWQIATAVYFTKQNQVVQIER
jgi:ATP-dependent helicase/nuclease subunit A